MAFNYSVMLNMAGKKVLVIGGGRVAVRKIKTLLNTNAIITVIAREVDMYIDEVANSGQITLVKRAYHPMDLDYYQPFFVCVATNNKNINAEIASECNKKDILVNTITNPELGNVAVQSNITKENYIVSISTFGESPAFSKELRVYLEKILDSHFDLVVKLYIDIRVWMQESFKDITEREKIINKLSFEMIDHIIKNENIVSYDELLKKVKRWLYYSLD